jgi:hypothetical protein
MKNKMVTDMHVDELLDYDWLSYEDGDGEEVVIRTDEEEQEAAKLWKVSPLAVKAMRHTLSVMTTLFVDHIREDLQNIWDMTNCAHDNALTAMAILRAENDADCGGDDSDDNEPPEPNPDDCLECPYYNKENNTCNQPPDVD